ncbi:MAG: biopolymer transporter ExbD [Chlamydiales bacterium]|nr:biopolymer transporter ExbD [Chlamydiia bacterium]MCP5508107.1 biopolymer transporter ExbD [Chlamydiales bacterium]
MSFISEEELKGRASFNLAPMIDFLFLMLMFFACLAITRATTKDTEIDLVEIRPDSHSTITDADTDIKVVNVSITREGSYKWVTDLQDYPMASAEAIGNELLLQYNQGLLPEDRLQTQVLLKIDREAHWESIMKALFAIRDAGFEARPVYEPETLTDNLASQMW